MTDNVLTLFEGLDQVQARALNLLALPVLRELRKALVSGEPRLVIDLDKLQKRQNLSKLDILGQPKT